MRGRGTGNEERGATGVECRKPPKAWGGRCRQVGTGKKLAHV